MTWLPGRSNGLRVALVAGVLVVLITEGLGVAGLLSRGPVLLCWVLAAAVLLPWHTVRPGAASSSRAAGALRGMPAAWMVVVTCLAVTFLTGLLAAPNSWDALTYHLPRIERWVTQGNLDPWPTSVDRQVWMSPWPAYAGLHLRLLTGGDALAFLPAWLGYLGCILLTARLVRELGGNHRAQAWGALVMALVPPAVHQATAVQTDVIAACWVLAALALVVEGWQDPLRAAGWRWPLALATASSLAFASKGTAALALAPWFVLLAVRLVRAAGPGALVRPLLTACAVVLALNLPHLLRARAVYGSPLGASWTLDMLQLSPLSPGRVTGNLVANLSLHAGTPWPTWNAGRERAVLRINAALGVDPAVQYRFYDGFRVNPFSTHESEAGMPVHLLLLAGSLLVVGAHWRRGPPSPLPGFLLAGTVGLVLLLAVLRWQPFGARLHLVGLAWLPAAAPLLIEGARRRAAIAGLMLATAAPALVAATPRPLLGAHSVLRTTRSDQFARERPEHFGAAEMLVLAAGVERCGQVGLMTGWDHPEYFLTAITRREGASLRWEHLLSTGVASRLSDAGPPAEVCAIFSAEPLPGLETPWIAEQFELFWSVPPLAVYTRRGGGRMTRAPMGGR